MFDCIECGYVLAKYGIFAWSFFGEIKGKSGNDESNCLCFCGVLKLLNNAIKFFSNGGDRFIQSSNGGLQP